MMPPCGHADELIAAASGLADLVARENAALDAVDLAAAAAMAPSKRSATQRFLRARAGVATLSADEIAALRAVGENLERLAAINRRLLERAIFVQGRVIGSLARAIPRGAGTPRYAADGMVAASCSQPVAFVARA
jgi:hypothetical protein